MELKAIDSERQRELAHPSQRNVEWAQKLNYQSKDITIHILREITAHHSLENHKIRLWDGSCWPDERGQGATLVLNRPSALKEMLLGGSEAALGEAYINRAFDIEGDIESAFVWKDLLSAHSWSWLSRLKVIYLLGQLPDRGEFGGQPTGSTRVSIRGHQHSMQRDRLAVRFHYDISNEFYALWLDPQMIYSCAYFEDKDDDIQQAQLNKLEYICRKLNLKPGERFLDIGCGWGGLIMHAARYFNVQADGITLSENQAALARERIQEAGLHGRVRVHLKDYRELKEYESYDAIASVGMVEHVGRKNLHEYFQQAYRLLRSGGLFLNHGISLGPVRWLDMSESFINKFVFPDGELLPIHLMLDAADDVHLEVRDVENLREHYTLTLRHWMRRLEARRNEALQYVDEKIFRIWKLYMAGAAYNFRVGHLSIYQTLLSKLSRNGQSFTPLTRMQWSLNSISQRGYGKFGRRIS